MKTFSVVSDNIVCRTRSADHIIAIGEGKIAEQGSFDKLNSMKGHFSSILLLEDMAEMSTKDNEVPLI